MTRRDLGVLLTLLCLGVLIQTDPRLIRLFLGNVAAMALLWAAILIPFDLFARALGALRAPRPQPAREFSWYLNS